MEGREKDIQNLCKQVLNVELLYHPDARKERGCPFCGNDCYYDEGIEDIKHEQSCAYLIAKDLSAGFNL